MECKFCGANIEDGSMFCPECGKSLNDEETPETVDEETVEETVEDVAEETETTEDIPEYETAEYGEDSADEEHGDLAGEYDEDVSDLEALDGADSDSVDLYDDYELKKVSKSPIIFKAIAIIAVLAIIVCGGLFAYTRITAPDTLPLVYTTHENDIYNTYAFKSSMKEPVLLSTSTKSLYSQNTDFVMTTDRIYYISNDSSLFNLDLGSKKAVKIADNAEKSSLVMSSDGRKLLYATVSAEGSGYDLYLYNGKSSEKISTIKSISVTSSDVNYGFSRSSDESIWYADIQKDAPASTDGTQLSDEEKAALSNGTLYVKIGNNNVSEYQTNVSLVKYFDIEGQTLVYTTKKMLDPETYSDSTLYLKEGTNEATVLVDNFYSQQVIAVEKPQKGIIYLSDSVQGTDEEGNYNFTSTFDLMFKPFGGEAVKIETGLTYVYNAQYLTSPLYSSFDYSVGKDSEDILLYIKDNKIFVTGDLTAQPEEAALDFASSAPPVFSEKMDKIAYISEEGTLFYRPMTNGKMGNAVQVAENVATFIISDDGSKIVYASTPDEENPTVATVSIYNTKNGKSTEIATDAYPLVYFSVDQKAVYYINNFDTTAQTVTLNEYKNGRHTVIKDKVSNFVTSETGVPYILSIPETEGGNDAAAETTATMYTFKNPGNVITIDENIVGISAY